MIIRIVRMHFKPSGIEYFLETFNAKKSAIRNFEGCTHLELLRDISNEAVFTTLSHWNDEASLDRYRNSALFREVWSGVKVHFAERTQAFSLSNFITVEP